MTFPSCHSLDCSHIGCFKCIVEGFPGTGSSCPKCHSFCRNPPQYNIQLETLLSHVCSNMGYIHHTAKSSSIDPKAFERLYNESQATVAAATQATDPRQQADLGIALIDPQHQIQAQVPTVDPANRADPAGVPVGVQESGHVRSMDL